MKPRFHHLVLAVGKGVITGRYKTSSSLYIMVLPSIKEELPRKVLLGSWLNAAQFSSQCLDQTVAACYQYFLLGEIQAHLKILPYSFLHLFAIMRRPWPNCNIKLTFMLHLHYIISSCVHWALLEGDEECWVKGGELRDQNWEQPKRCATQSTKWKAQ